MKSKKGKWAKVFFVIFLKESNHSFRTWIDTFDLGFCIECRKYQMFHWPTLFFVLFGFQKMPLCI
jgi:hypothetical protein